MRGVRRAGPLWLAGLLAVASLAGCASETERYCDDLAEKKPALAELATGTGDGDALTQTVEIFRDLHDAAPGDIKDEWSTLVFAYEGLVDAFDAGGTTPGEYDPAAPPAGVSEQEADRIEDAAAELGSARVLGAADGLEQHSRDVCKVDLGLSSGQG